MQEKINIKSQQLVSLFCYQSPNKNAAQYIWANLQEIDFPTSQLAMQGWKLKFPY